MSEWGSSVTSDGTGDGTPAALASSSVVLAPAAPPAQDDRDPLQPQMSVEPPLIPTTETWSKWIADLLDEYRTQRVQRGASRPMVHASICTGMLAELLGLEVGTIQNFYLNH